MILYRINIHHRRRNTEMQFKRRSESCVKKKNGNELANGLVTLLIWWYCRVMTCVLVACGYGSRSSRTTHALQLTARILWLIRPWNPVSWRRVQVFDMKMDQVMIHGIVRLEPTKMMVIHNRPYTTFGALFGGWTSITISYFGVNWRVAEAWVVPIWVLLVGADAMLQQRLLPKRE